MTKPQTITQKILAAHAGKDYVEPGELILAKVDIALGNDITAPLAIKAFQEAGAQQVFDRERVVLVADHFAPNKDIPSAIQCQIAAPVRPGAGPGPFLRRRRHGGGARPAARRRASWAPAT